jgi:hypothetical protein
MKLEELFESEASDKADRLAANIAYMQLRNYLERRSDYPETFKWVSLKDENCIYVRASDLDMDEYRDLIIVLSPKDKGRVHADGSTWSSQGGLMRKDGKTYLIVACLRASGDPTHVDTRLSGAKRVFIHEMTHYLLGLRKNSSTPSGVAVAAGNLKGYYNDPDETNAYYQEAAQGITDIFRGIIEASPEHTKKWRSKSTVEIVNWIMHSYLDRDFLKYATEKTLRALKKRFARFVDTTLRPMLTRSEMSPT